MWREPSVHGRLSRRSLTEAGLQHISEKNICDITRRYPGLGDGFAGSGGT
jgi:hypothetical protein